MCYNIHAKARIEALQKRFSAFSDDYALIQEYDQVSGFAHPDIPVIASDEPNKIVPMRWGLIPFWTKDEAQAKEMQDRTLNAKGETVFKLPSFRTILKKRCLILVDGFYEWQHQPSPTGKGVKKIKYEIMLKDHEPFALGGLYDEWTNRNTGEIIRGFSIITVPANPLMSVIHNTKKRMPLIIPKENEKDWLNTQLTKEQVADLIKQYPEELMEAEIAA